MNLSNSILEDIRVAVGLPMDSNDFDTDLLMHINAAIGTLNQNGIGRDIVVTDSSINWERLKDPDQTEGNKSFKMIPLFIQLSTKILFDPPPPSSVQYHQEYRDQLLWRLKMAYE